MSSKIVNLSLGKQVRQELLFSVYEKYETEKIAASLISLAERIIKSEKGLLRGEVIGPMASFISETNLVGIYTCIPVFLRPTFKYFMILHLPLFSLGLFHC